MATFYIEALESTDIYLNKVGTPEVGIAHYGVNDNTVPNEYSYGNAISLVAGDKCYWTITSTSTDFTNNKCLRFNSAGNINVGGNISDLIGGELSVPRNFCFTTLFANCTKLQSASNLNLNVEIGSMRRCYYQLFQGCTSLTQIPDLSSTTLAESCFQAMFRSCSSLNQIPILPATTLAKRCYSNMFTNCTSLTQQPVLPATTLAENCYDSMFSGCTSLTRVASLPATTLAIYCYYYMYGGCTGLTHVPKLPATTLNDYCYCGMFGDCTGLKLSISQTQDCPYEYRMPTQGTGIVSTNSLFSMFLNTGGTFTGTPEINTTYYANWASCEITYNGETIYNDTLGYPASITYNNSTLATLSDETTTLACKDKYMSTDVNVGGKILKCANKTMSDNVNVQYGHDYLCFTAVEATDVAFELSNELTTLPTLQYRINNGNWTNYTFGNTISLLQNNRCYWKGDNNSFSESSSSYIQLSSTGKIKLSGNIMSLLDSTCQSLTIPNEYCFIGLFANANIISAPKLPATNLNDYCYYGLFKGSSIVKAPELPATTLANECYRQMFYDCANLIEAPELPATTLANSCYRAMFKNCTSFTKAPELPATLLPAYCYSQMLEGCTGIEGASQLIADVVYSSSCNALFRNCTALVKVPKLFANLLKQNCYNQMFNGCTSLQVSDTQTEYAPYAWNIPESGTFTNETEYNQGSMFLGCLGSRSSSTMSGALGESHTYYTQNMPV